ncbi:MAG TPA: hypothetical protein VER79_03330 [Candidatus Limnocylindrales bacterium]|nr:hypothetical protein [Candidatus Limnocylindrales bacterium]
MSYQERRSLASLISIVIVSAGYTLFTSVRMEAAGPGVASDLHFWASTVLILIPVYIVFEVFTQIIFIVINVIATGREESELSDEFDRLIDLKSTRNFYHVFMAGFVLSLVSQVLEQPPQTMFVILLLGILAAGVVQELSRVYYYRRGV